VLHPGLASHPQHELARQQSTGFSGMVSFFIIGGKSRAASFAKNLKYELKISQPNVNEQY